MVVSGSSIVAAWRRGTTVLLLVMAYRSFGRFRQASTHLDTPPLSLSHHPVSGIAPACTRAGRTRAAIGSTILRSPGSSSPAQYDRNGTTRSDAPAPT